MLAAGYVSVHCSPAGSLPAGEESERFIETVAAAAAVVEESVKDDCAQAAQLNPGRIPKSANPKNLTIETRPRQ